jgi:hypothetical protein
MEPNTLRSGNFCTTSALLTATGAEAVYDTTVTLQACVKGKAIVAVTAVTDGTTPTTDATSGAAITMTASQGKCIVWCVDAAATVKVLAGTSVAWDGTAFQVPPPFPDVPDTLTPFAYQILKTSSTAGTITFGTSNWNATGFTSAIVNVFTLPSRPQVS